MRKTLGSILITKHLIPNRITLAKFAESIEYPLDELDKILVYQRSITMKLSKKMGDRLGTKEDYFFKVAEKDKKDETN